MRQLDEQERKIIEQLIKNPRISDNAISKKTKVPVMTVNRKRKSLEKEGLLTYYVSVKKHSDGLGIFNVRQLYIIKLREGITRQDYVEKIENDPSIKMFNFAYISATFLGEQDGHLAIITILDAKNDPLLMEEFNGKIINFLKKKLGKECIHGITTARINSTVRMHHNYLPQINMKNGTLKPGWPEELIFVDAPTNVDQTLIKDFNKN